MLKENAKLIARKKSIHVNIAKTHHRSFRSKLFLNELTMQQFLEFCVEKFINDDSRMVKIVEELKKDLREKELNKLRGIDEKELYDVIEENSPFN